MHVVKCSCCLVEPSLQTRRQVHDATALAGFGLLLHSITCETVAFPGVLAAVRSFTIVQGLCATHEHQLCYPGCITFMVVQQDFMILH